MFQRIVQIANKYVESDHVTLSDHQANRYANHATLLADVLELQAILLRKLSRDTRKALSSTKDVVILLSAPAGYDWLVAFLAILSLGAVVSPICQSTLSLRVDFSREQCHLISPGNYEHYWS